MKRILLGSVGLIALGMAAPAFAADLPARTYTKAPPMIAAIYDWSGFYIGANGGWGSSRSSWDYLGPGLAVGSEGSHDADGAVAGGQIGYRWQAGTWVFGLEAQGNWADLSGSNISSLFITDTIRTKVDAFGLFTGQFGYAWNNALLYVKGGAGVVSSKYDAFTTATGAALGSANSTRWGGTAGVGLEYGFAPNWSVAVEYDHVWLDTKSADFYNAGAYVGTDNIRQDLDLVTARLNYRWGGPMVARY
uniref:Putative outer membrane protein n=1 Tax=Rhodopseudomonas palustris (strain BisA53) TaxID=316055 RepID=Q07MK8_RHOP5